MPSPPGEPPAPPLTPPPAEAQVTVSINDEQDVPVDHIRLRELARNVALAEGAHGEISIIVVGIKRITDLNEQYLFGDGPTDVLSFPIDGLVTSAPKKSGPPVIIGEVLLCPEIAAEQAPDVPGGFASECDLLIAHGVLHLLGFDHDSEEGAAAMREREMAACGRSGAQASPEDEADAEE